ncbi:MULTISPECIES: ROK family transcriptional regulator [Aliiglaciecola]|uniref:ROK family transcriptional regulator n=1 Tax=Aliiglaciecola TaxID=1406885 RepID=UPI001C0971A4|nr:MULTISPECIES: ROK family transcriptional regulator [Aliiglaciecola]MBU2877353.1 ROK family transcriptional regulator [Aliiglaciecola lipolytica]MDO6713001.1 ROK family transcriptional regulator [Aliiglaciecola sp. 2_MG-2023]MDO6754040.1 ROK family transcriptional regulator [Aliiglaciecola sp. 1_MG-2023]
MLSSKNGVYLRNSFKLGKGGKLFQDNERDVLKLVFWSKNVNQRTIVDATKIPQQSVSRLVKNLLEKGVLLQTDRISSSSRGNPSFELEPNPTFAYCFGLSILLDAVGIALMDFAGNVVDTRLQELKDMSIENVLSQSELIVNDLIKVNHIDESKVLGMGVGISGFFSAMDGKMNTHHLIEEWAQVDIAQIVSLRFKLPTWVVNDATGAAAGEGIAGVGRNYKNFVYFFISYGFGGGLVSNNEVLRGTYGNAGELGDMLPSKIYSHPNLALLKRILIKNNVEVHSIYNLHNNFDVNWPGVEEWIYKVQDSLDLVATACSALLDTQAIVLGGHIPVSLAEKLIPRIDVYAQFRRGAKRPLPKIVTAGVQECPVAVGAASLPLRELCL